MENQDTPRQPEPNEKQRFNRCSYQLRDLPLGLFRMASDGRKWQQSARSRYRLLSTLARYAHPDGTFAASKNKSYLPKAKNLLRKENIAAKTYYRLTGDLRELGWLSWNRAKNHYGQRLYTIHFQQEKHLSYSAQESRIRQVITPVTTTGDSRKTPVTTTGDNTCHIRSQSHEKAGDRETDQYSHPPFDDLPPSKNSKTGSVVSSRGHHQSRPNTQPKRTDDDVRESANDRTIEQRFDREAKRIEALNASAFRRLQEQFPEFAGSDELAYLQSCVDGVIDRAIYAGTRINSDTYIVSSVRRHLTRDPFDREPERTDSRTTVNTERTSRDPNCPVDVDAGLRVANKAEANAAMQVTRKAFEKFWRQYPRRGTEKIWIRELWTELKCTAVAPGILTGLDRWLRSPLWKRDKRRIPDVRTFLAKEIWKQLPPDVATRSCA